MLGSQFVVLALQLFVHHYLHSALGNSVVTSKNEVAKATGAERGEESLNNENIGKITVYFTEDTDKLQSVWHGCKPKSEWWHFWENTKWEVPEEIKREKLGICITRELITTRRCLMEENVLGERDVLWYEDIGHWPPPAQTAMAQQAETVQMLSLEQEHKNGNGNLHIFLLKQVPNTPAMLWIFEPKPVFFPREFHPEDIALKKIVVKKNAADHKKADVYEFVTITGTDGRLPKRAFHEAVERIRPFYKLEETVLKE